MTSRISVPIYILLPDAIYSKTFEVTGAVMVVVPMAMAMYLMVCTLLCGAFSLINYPQELNIGIRV